jgi:hypothetical protein
MFPGALRREIVILLSLKAVALVVLYLLFFAPAHQFKPTAGQLGSHILGE